MSDAPPTLASGGERWLAPPRPLLLSDRTRRVQRLLGALGQGALLVVTSSSALAVLFIFYFIARDAVPFFQLRGFREFFTGAAWYPAANPPQFGAYPIFIGSLLVTLGAAALAVPLGVAAAVCLSDILPFAVRQYVKPVIEVLAAIPSVAYGFFALVVLAPLLQSEQGRVLLAAGWWCVAGPAAALLVVLLGDLAAERPMRVLAMLGTLLGGLAALAVLATWLAGVGTLLVILTWCGGLPLVGWATVRVGAHASGPAVPERWRGLVRLAGLVLLGGAAAVLVWGVGARLASLSIDTGTNALNVALILGVMALPTVISVSEDALQAVGRELREGAYALGATRSEMLIGVVIPAAGSGIGAAVILGLMRAVGETMVVWMASGNAPQVPQPWYNLLAPVRTLTATIAGEMGEADHVTGSERYHVLFAMALVLLTISFACNLLSEWIVRAPARRWRRR